MDHFTPFGGRATPPKQIELRDPPLWTYRIVAILFALCCASGGWLLNDTVDALVRLDREIASAGRR